MPSHPVMWRDPWTRSTVTIECPKDRDTGRYLVFFIEMSTSMSLATFFAGRPRSYRLYRHLEKRMTKVGSDVGRMSPTEARPKQRSR